MGGKKREGGDRFRERKEKVGLTQRDRPTETEWSNSTTIALAPFRLQVNLHPEGTNNQASLNDDY